MSRTSRLHQLAAAAFVVLVVAGCGARDQTVAPAGTGVLNVGLAVPHKAPTSLSTPAAMNGDSGDEGAPAISSLRLTFDIVRVFPADDDPACSGWGPAGDGGGCPFFAVLDQPITVDVFSLTDSLSAILGTLALPEGRYSHLALHVSDVVAAGPYGDILVLLVTDRLKIEAPFSIEQGQVRDLVLTIDLSQSLRWNSMKGQLTLDPVFHAADRESD